MMVPVLSMLFDVVLACLLAVMIFYAVRLNTRILSLKERESELQDMILQFNHSSSAAHASASTLKSAGTEAEFGVKAAVAKAMALRNDLATMIDEGNRLAARLDQQATRQAQLERSGAKTEATAQRAPAPPARTSRQPETQANVRPFQPPSGAKQAVINRMPAVETDHIAPRTAAERHLLDAIRAAKEGVA
tara:strand:- start:95 stop:667 length:573 start_codon:yes stop_codon:yes gene_type:complete